MQCNKFIHSNREITTYDLAELIIECDDGFLTSCCCICCVGVPLIALAAGAVAGELAGSALLIGFIVFFMISSSVSPTNLWPILGSLFTMLCVNDVDGRLLRADGIFRVGVSIVLSDEFMELDDAVKPPGGRAAKADGFVRFASNESLP